MGAKTKSVIREADAKETLFAYRMSFQGQVLAHRKVVTVILRLSGGFLIVLGCGCFGFSVAANYRDRILDLYEIVRLLELIKAELSYRLTPLPTLMRRVAGQSYQYQKLLCRFADTIDSQVLPDLCSCMKIALGTQVTDHISSVFQRLAASLGNYDLQGQLRQLDGLVEQIRREIKELEEKKDAKLKLYKTLGLCAGSALAILLF